MVQLLLLIPVVIFIGYCLYRLVKAVNDIPVGGGFFNEENELP